MTATTYHPQSEAIRVIRESHEALRRVNSDTGINVEVRSASEWLMLKEAL